MGAIACGFFFTIAYSEQLFIGGNLAHCWRGPGAQNFLTYPTHAACDDLKAGRVDAILTWHMDRRHRQPAELVAPHAGPPYAHARAKGSRRSLLRWSAPGPGHLWYWCTVGLASTPHSIRWWASAADDHGKSRAIMCGFALVPVTEAPHAGPPYAHARAESSRRSSLRWSAPGPGHLWYWSAARGTSLRARAGERLSVDLC